MSFTVLLVALIPLSYLFTTSLEAAGQSTNQQTALSIAERWVETLSNTTPPVNANTGASSFVGTQAPARRRRPFVRRHHHQRNQTLSSSTTTITVAANGTTNFAAASASNPQVAYVVTGTGSAAVTNQITYTASTSNTITCACSSISGSATMNSGNAVTQTEIATPTELRGGTTYTLKAEYDWATVQNTGVVSIAMYSTSVGQALPQSTIYLAASATSNLLAATTTSPQTLKVPTSAGTQTVSYTGVTVISSSEWAITGVTGGTGTISSGNATQTAQPNLCTSGTPQLLKLTVFVSWGPNADVNNVQDSVMLNYPPSGVQTLGFIALQISGDSSANDAQGDPWSERVTSIPVTISGSQETLSLYPDENGCVFAQVEPGNYTVTVNNASSGTPAGTTYGSPSFVANTTGSWTNNVWSPYTSEPQGGTPTIPVSIGAVTRVDTSYSTNYPSYDQAATINFSYPTSTSVEDGVTCPGAAQVACVASGENAGSAGADVLWQNALTNNWSSLALPGGAALTRQTSVACAGTTACIGVGYGTSGAVITRGSTGASPSLGLDTLPTLSGGATITNLSQVTCPSATQCVAIGTTSTNLAVVLSGTIGSTSGACSTAGADCWTAATLPATVTALSSLQCPTTATGCVAVGTTTTAGAPVIVTGPVAGGELGHRHPDRSHRVGPDPGDLPVVDQLHGHRHRQDRLGDHRHPGGAVRSGDRGHRPGHDRVDGHLDGRHLQPHHQHGDVGVVDRLPGHRRDAQVSGHRVGTSGTTSGAMFLYGPPAGPLASEFPMTGTSTISSITQVTCPSATQCVAIGLSSTTPVTFTGTINSTPSTADTWAYHVVPSTGGAVNVLNQVTCPTTNNCLIMGTGTSTSGLPSGFLFSTSTGTSWTNVSLPSGDNVTYFDGIACTSGSTTNCAAVGTTPTSAVVLSSTTGPAGSWSDTTPSGLGGYHPTGIPIEINNSSLAPSSYLNAVTTGYTGSITQLPLLFPFQAGYSMWAGDCAAEGSSHLQRGPAATIPAAEFPV